MERFNELKDDMNNHSLREYPKEAVGIVTKILNIFHVKIFLQHQNYFLLDPADLVKK